MSSVQSSVGVLYLYIYLFWSRGDPQPSIVSAHKRNRQIGVPEIPPKALPLYLVLASLRHLLLRALLSPPRAQLALHIPRCPSHPATPLHPLMWLCGKPCAQQSTSVSNLQYDGRNVTDSLDSKLYNAVVL